MRESIVLVPGIDGTGVSFHRQVPLLQRKYAVTQTRLRDDDRHRMPDLIDDLRRVVDQSDGPVTLVGESFGGALSMSFALEHPERVRRLLIVNSFAHFDSQAQLRLAYQLTRAMPWGLMPLARRIATSRMHSPHTEREAIREYQRLMRDAKKGGLLARLRILRDYDLRDRLAALQAPVLFLAADLDNLVPSVEQARLMQGLAPRATMRVLQGHGHTCLIAPDIDLSTILDEGQPS